MKLRLPINISGNASPDQHSVFICEPKKWDSKAVSDFEFEYEMKSTFLICRPTMKTKQPYCFCFNLIFFCSCILLSSDVQAETWYRHTASGMSLAKQLGDYLGEKIEYADERDCKETCGDYILYRGKGCTASIALPKALKVENLPKELAEVELKLGYDRMRQGIVESGAALYKELRIIEETRYEEPRAFFCLYMLLVNKNDRKRSGARCLGLLGEHELSIAITCSEDVFSPEHNFKEPPEFVKLVGQAASQTSK